MYRNVQRVTDHSRVHPMRAPSYVISLYALQMLPVYYMCVLCILCISVFISINVFESHLLTF